MTEIEYRDKQILCAERRNELLNKQTESEKVFQKKLEHLKIPFIAQKGFIAGDNFCIVDFYLPKPFKLCIEIDGAYHNTERQQWRDANKNFYLEKQRKFRVLRLSNEEAINVTEKELLNKLSIYLYRKFVPHYD